MLKVELHAHTASDPCDYVPHSTRDLIDRASALGYDALAVTLHDRYYDPSADRDYASGKGVLLLAGVERTLAGRHVLLVNFPGECATVRDFADIRDLKARYPHGLVVAPHAFYPIGSALSGEVERWADLIDAVPASRKILFTATPFRRDRGEIRARFVYSYPVDRAFRDGIFGRIAYVPVSLTPDDQNSDAAIARKTEEVFIVE